MKILIIIHFLLNYILAQELKTTYCGEEFAHKLVEECGGYHLKINEPPMEGRRLSTDFWHRLITFYNLCCNEGCDDDGFLEFC